MPTDAATGAITGPATGTMRSIVLAGIVFPRAKAERPAPPEVPRRTEGYGINYAEPAAEADFPSVRSAAVECTRTPALTSIARRCEWRQKRVRPRRADYMVTTETVPVEIWLHGRPCAAAKSAEDMTNRLVVVVQAGGREQQNQA